MLAFWAVRCSAPGPVLAPAQGEFAPPGLYSMQVLDHRFRENIAAYVRVQDQGSAEIWQLSRARDGKLRLLQMQGQAYRGSGFPLAFRPSKCFYYAKDTPEADRVPLEVFTCDHLAVAFSRSPACSDCLVSVASDTEMGAVDSAFLYGKTLIPVTGSGYHGKKVDAYSDHTQVWYWGLTPNGEQVATGLQTPAGKVRTAVDGFVQVAPGPGPETIRFRLPETGADLF